MGRLRDEEKRSTLRSGKTLARGRDEEEDLLIVDYKDFNGSYQVAVKKS